MKSSFSKFCSENSKVKGEAKTKENIQEAYDELKDLNSDELTKKLYEEVKKQKENGDFNYEALCDNVERLKMFIPNETYQNMKSMLEKIK